METINKKNSILLLAPFTEIPKHLKQILNNLLKKVNQEQKTVYLLGDFILTSCIMININQEMNFLIHLPSTPAYHSRYTSHSRTLIENISALPSQKNNFWQYCSYQF